MERMECIYQFPEDGLTGFNELLDVKSDGGTTILTAMNMNVLNYSNTTSRAEQGRAKRAKRGGVS